MTSFWIYVVRQRVFIKNSQKRDSKHLLLNFVDWFLSESFIFLVSFFLISVSNNIKFIIFLISEVFVIVFIDILLHMRI